MELDETTLRDVVVRLRKVQGQLGGLVQMLEAGRDCKEIITQLAAASRALDRVGFRIVASGLKECVAGAGAGSPRPRSTGMNWRGSSWRWRDKLSASTSRARCFWRAHSRPRCDSVGGGSPGAPGSGAGSTRASSPRPDMGWPGRESTRSPARPSLPAGSWPSSSIMFTRQAPRDRVHATPRLEIRPRRTGTAGRATAEPGTNASVHVRHPCDTFAPQAFPTARPPEHGAALEAPSCARPFTRSSTG
jgi:DNA-binding FrmR family transcriptional regulator